MYFWSMILKKKSPFQFLRIPSFDLKSKSLVLLEKGLLFKETIWILGIQRNQEIMAKDDLSIIVLL